MQPIDLNKRIDTLDYLRGFALLGIILVNIPILMSFETTTSFDITYSFYLTLFVEGKFFSIFAFLFGVGFYIFISRAKAKNEKAYLLFIRRIVILFLLGLVHLYFYKGDALTGYAVFGLIALPFYKVRKEINITIGLILLAVTAYYGDKFFMVFPLILLGLAAGQYRIFEKINENWKSLFVFTIIMFCISIGGLLYQWGYFPHVAANYNNMSVS